jgi:hypothetical protein
MKRHITLLIALMLLQTVPLGHRVRIYPLDRVPIYVAAKHLVLVQDLAIVQEVQETLAWNAVKASFFPRQALWVIPNKGKTILGTYDSVTATQLIVTSAGKTIYINKSDVKEIATSIER